MATIGKHWLSILTVISVCLMLLGFALALFCICVITSGRFPTDIELPLGGFSGIAVGRDDRIFCGSEGYRRIQIYSSKGDFLKAITLRGGPFRFYVRSPGVLRVDTGTYVLSCSLDGELISKTPRIAEHGKEFADLPKKRATDSKGNVYRIARGSWLFPRVERITPSGERSTVISQPWYLWAIQHPLPSFLYLCLGVFGIWICFFIRWVRKKKKQQGSATREMGK